MSVQDQHYCTVFVVTDTIERRVQKNLFEENNRLTARAHTRTWFMSISDGTNRVQIGDLSVFRSMWSRKSIVLKLVKRH